MAETAIIAVLSKLGELAASEASILLQVGDDIILLRDRLEWLQAFVRDADRKRRAGTDGLTRVWVRQTRDVAFEAEDAIDDFFYDEVLGIKRQSYGLVRNILHKYFTCFFTQIVVRHELSSRIKIIKSRLDQISANQKEYNINHIPSVSLSSSTTAIAAWRDDLENAVGFDEDVEILMQKLRDNQTFIISIVGESGAGKNTLAKIIRREMATLPEIEIIVWYHMEPCCSTENLIRFLIDRATAYIKYHNGASRHPWPNNQYETLEEGLPRRKTQGQTMHLRDILNGKRYLLILSGISSKNILNSVRACLPDPNQDNGIGGHVLLILDTEHEETAWHADTMNRDGVCGVHVLTRLDQGRSGQLFFWKVLRKGQSEKGTRSSNPKDSEYSRLVHDITGGYPMAIVLLAGLLRFKEKPAQWDAVLHQLKSECETQESSKEGLITRQANLCGTRRAVEIIFWASFEDLSNDLKSCFLYLAGYPKSYSYSADMIVRMWIAEGFIKQPEDGNTMEDLGHDYLKELVLRCLVELDDLKEGGGIKLVRVHKSLMRLLQSEAREVGFMEIHNTYDTLIPPSARRLSVQNGSGSRYTSTFADKKLPKLRSFICHIMIMQNHEQEFKFFRWSRFIRVISVQGLNIRELPDETGDMINLRYLRIESLELSNIPSTIARLLNLQTLDISKTTVETIDKGFWKIKTLRHVLVFKLEIPTRILSEDDGARELQTLQSVCPDDTEWSEGNCPLDNMPNLRSLEMCYFDYARNGGTAFRSALKEMHLLGHLDLRGDRIPSYVLTHPNLRSLQTMVLCGRIEWDDVIDELPEVVGPLRMVRPNLVQLRMDNRAVTRMPQSIKKQLKGILIQEEGEEEGEEESEEESIEESEEEWEEACSETGGQTES